MRGPRPRAEEGRRSPEGNDAVARADKLRDMGAEVVVADMLDIIAVRAAMAKPRTSWRVLCQVRVRIVYAHGISVSL